MRNYASVEYKRRDPKCGVSALMKLVKAQTGQAGNHQRSRIRIPPPPPHPRNHYDPEIETPPPPQPYFFALSQSGVRSRMEEGGGCIGDHVRDSEGKTPMYVTEKRKRARVRGLMVHNPITRRRSAFVSYTVVSTSLRDCNCSTPREENHAVLKVLSLIYMCHTYYFVKIVNTSHTEN